MFKRPVSYLNKLKPLCCPSCNIRNYQNKYCQSKNCIPNNTQLLCDNNYITNCNNTIKKDLNNKYYKCNPNYLQYELNNNEINFLMSYGIASYYFKRILNEIEICRNMLERPGTEYYATIRIPPEYFQNIKKEEIYKVYKPKQLLNIYYYIITNKRNFL